MYVYALGSMLRQYGIDYHIYVDDTQLYLKFNLSDPRIVLDKINLCISDIRTWKIKNKLKIMRFNGAKLLNFLKNIILRYYYRIQVHIVY